MPANPFETDLDKNAANYVPLTPLQFLERAASVFPNRRSIVHGELNYSWAETYTRARQLASALAKAGVGKGNTVSIIAANTPAMYEAHFGVPMSGAVLNTINTRLDAATIGFIFDHGEADVLLVDAEFAPVAREALAISKRKIKVVDIADAAVASDSADPENGVEYETFISGGDPDFQWEYPADEWNAISLNYTSGTTGNPKGVVYHHRGAYLNSMSNAIGWSMPQHPVYLWTLPMFHCNGWCFPWTLAALAGTSVCLRKVEAGAIYSAIAERHVTHFCGAPIVLGMVINATETEVKPFEHTVHVMTAAAPPPPSVLAEMQSRGFHMTHTYGLTETYGPSVICAWNEDWASLEPQAQAEKSARQGVRYHALEGLDVIDPETMTPVPRNGEVMGEVMFRGNIVMKGYLKNPDATKEAFEGGWFHSGDLGVMHDDNYAQLKDRSKDIIISGGENISSIEIEDALYRHPSVQEAAVVARPDEKWGETPCAFVSLKPDAAQLSEQDIVDFCREHLASFKLPKTVVFQELPKTSTGKVQKFKLRDVAEAL